MHHCHASNRPNVLAFSAVVAVALALSSCAGGDVSGIRSQAPPETGPTIVRECDGVEGSSIDVKGEPNWRPYGDYRPWTDRDGCLLRIDVLAERAGPAHCGWEEANVIVAGRPLGSRYTDQRDVVEYVKDPKNVFGQPALAEAFDPDAELPATAVDSGFRRGDAALWHVPGDEGAVWVVAPSITERWPAGTPPGCL